MSGYVPLNGPISVAMVATGSTAGLLFWAWTNQSQNALVNYFNRNADSEMSNETLAKSYGTAVTTALTVGFVLSTVVRKRFSAEKGMFRDIHCTSTCICTALHDSPIL